VFYEVERQLFYRGFEHSADIHVELVPTSVYFCSDKTQSVHGYVHVYLYKSVRHVILKRSRNCFLYTKKDRNCQHNIVS